MVKGKALALVLMVLVGMKGPLVSDPSQWMYNRGVHANSALQEQFCSGLYTSPVLAGSFWDLYEQWCMAHIP